MFTKGFRKTAYDTASMMKRAPIMPSKSQAQGLKAGLEGGGPSFGQAMGNIGREVKNLFGIGGGAGKSFNTGNM